MKCPSGSVAFHQLRNSGPQVCLSSDKMSYCERQASLPAESPMAKYGPVMAILTLCAVVIAEETSAPNPATVARDAHRAAMKRVARSLELTVPQGKEPLTVRNEPL